MIPEPAARARGLLFLHIPKTAGTSLKRFLSQHFPADDCLLDPPKDATVGTGALDGFGFVAGHLDYDVVARYRRRPFVLTCLRDPIERALSAFYYQRTPRLAIQIKTALPQLGARAAAEALDGLHRLQQHTTLRDFLRAEPALAQKTMGNLQTEYLAGATACAEHRGDPRALSAVAFRNLEACDGILLAERLSETLRLIETTWADGLRIVPRDNRTDDRPARDEHSPDDIAALAELTSLDLALYRRAEQLIEERRSMIRPRAFSPAPLPDAADFRFDQPITGHGWHVRERDASGTVFCWTERDAVVQLQPDTAVDHRLECTVEHASCAEAWSTLEVTVNGQPLTVHEKPDAPPGTMYAQVDGALLRGSPGPVSIGFRVARTIRPSDGDPGNPDTRQLGIAISRIRLTAI